MSAHNLGVRVAVTVALLFTGTRAIAKDTDPASMKKLFLVQLDPIPKDVLELKEKSGKKLFLRAGEVPFIVFEGAIKKPGYKLAIDGKDVAIEKGQFRHKQRLPKESTQLIFTLTDDNGKSTPYRLLAQWGSKARDTAAAPEAAAPAAADAKEEEEPPAPAAATPEPEEKKAATSSATVPTQAQFSRFNWKAFQTGGVFAIQGAGGNCFSAEAAWAPSYLLGDSTLLRGNFGILPYKKISGGMFIAAEYELHLRQLIAPMMDIEVGAGAQTWFGYGGTAPVISATFGLLKSKHPFRFWSGYQFADRFFFGYGILISTNTTHQFKLGVNLVF